MRLKFLAADHAILRAAAQQQCVVVTCNYGDPQSNCCLMHAAYSTVISDTNMNDDEWHTGDVDALVRDIYLAFVRVHVLHHAAEGPIYGVEMIEELARHGYQIGPGTMYPTLHALREKGYLAEERRVVGGKVRKYYHITETGRLALALVRPKVRELVGEVLAERQGEEADKP